MWDKSAWTRRCFSEQDAETCLNSVWTDPSSKFPQNIFVESYLARVKSVACDQLQKCMGKVWELADKTWIIIIIFNPITIWQRNRKQDANNYSYDEPNLDMT